MYSKKAGFLKMILIFAQSAMLTSTTQPCVSPGSVMGRQAHACALIKPTRSSAQEPYGTFAEPQASTGFVLGLLLA